MRNAITGLVCVAALMTGGCVREARIAMPSDFAAQAEVVELTGMGGFEQGSFRLGNSEGRFTRASAQFGGLITRNEGGGSFGVEGADVGGLLSGTCAFDEEELAIGSVSAPLLRFAYACELERDGAPTGGLRLREVPSRPGNLLSGVTRAGEARFAGEELEIRPVHEMEGGRLPTGTPLGYAFFADGRQVGAVDLNGPNKTLYLPRSGSQRQAVMAASLALSILWDPAAT